jgi:choline dehydrogenase
MKHTILTSTLLLLPTEAAVAAYDYVVVGGGTCGLLVANRLSRDSRISVAIVDPGSDQRNNPLVQKPAGSIALFRSLATNWDYTTVPQANASNRRLEIHSGRGLGGSSLINGE